MHPPSSEAHARARARCSRHECQALLERYGVCTSYYRIVSQQPDYTEFTCHALILQCLRQLNERIDFVELERAQTPPIDHPLRELDFALRREDLALKIDAQHPYQPNVLIVYARLLYLCCVNCASESEVKNLEARTAHDWLGWIYQDSSDISIDDRETLMKQLLTLWDLALARDHEYHWLAYGQFHTPRHQFPNSCLKWLGVSDAESKECRTANELIKRCAFKYDSRTLHTHEWQEDDTDDLVSLADIATFVPFDVCDQIFKQIQTLHKDSPIFQKPRDTLLLFVTHPKFRQLYLQFHLQAFLQTRPGSRIFNTALNRAETSKSGTEIMLSLLVLWTCYDAANDLSSKQDEMTTQCCLTQFINILRQKSLPTQGSSTQARTLMIMIRDFLDAIRTYDWASKIPREYILDVVDPDLKVDIVDSFNQKYWNRRFEPQDPQDSTTSYFRTIAEGYTSMLSIRDQVEMQLWHGIYRHMRNWCFYVAHRVFCQTVNLDSNWESCV